MTTHTTTQILDAVSALIASGQGFSRNESRGIDVFESTVTIDGTTYEVQVDWPDGAEAHELSPGITELAAKTYVTDGEGRYLVQLPSDNQFGFSLFDDDQEWPGGFGSGMRSWRAVEPEQVPAADRERLGYLLES